MLLLVVFVCCVCIYFRGVVVVLWLLVCFLRFMCMLFYINLRPLRFPLRPCLATIAAIAGSLEHPLGAGIAGQGPAGASRSNLVHLVEEMIAWMSPKRRELSTLGSVADWLGRRQGRLCRSVGRRARPRERGGRPQCADFILIQI
jgi:hypothetical protein